MSEGDFNGERGSGRTWIDAGLEGGPPRAREEYGGALVRGAPADFGFTENQQRLVDLRVLHALCDDQLSPHGGGLKDAERQSFEDMRNALESPNRKYDTLSPKQREWAYRRAEELSIDVGDDPAERNRNVPRGREVESRAAQLGLPLSPPGRSLRVGAVEFEVRAPAERGGLSGPDDLQGGEAEGPPSSPLYSRGGEVQWPGGPCMDCGEPVKKVPGGLACKNGHGWADPNAERPVLRPEKLPERAPDIISARPAAPRRRPAAMGSRK